MLLNPCPIRTRNGPAHPSPGIVDGRGNVSLHLRGRRPHDVGPRGYLEERHDASVVVLDLDLPLIRRERELQRPGNELSRGRQSVVDVVGGVIGDVIPYPVLNGSHCLALDLV